MPRRLLDPTDEHLEEWSEFRDELIERTAVLPDRGDAWVKLFSLRPGRPAECLISHARGELRVLLGVAAKWVDPPALDLAMLDDQWTPRGARKGLLRYEAAWEVDHGAPRTPETPTSRLRRLIAWVRGRETVRAPHVSRDDVAEAMDAVFRALRLHLDHVDRRELSWHVASRTPEWARGLAG